MAQFKPTIQPVSQILDNQANNHPLAQKNLAGGLSFKIESAAQELLVMVSSPNFNEPSYYGKGPDAEGLTDLSHKIIALFKAVAQSDKPEDLLAIAAYTRNEKYVRTTPALMYAIASGEGRINSRIEEFAPKILKRADDILQAFTAYNHFYGSSDVSANGRAVHKTSFRKSFQRGIWAALKRQDEYTLLKYEPATGWPRFKDVLLTINAKGQEPIPTALRLYLKKGIIRNPEELPIALARQELLKLDGKWSTRAAELALKAHSEWSDLSERFPNHKKEIWEFLVDGGPITLPYMAMVKNLKNMEKAGISDAHWEKVRTTLAAGVAKSQMYPFNYMSAREAVTTTEGMHAADTLLDSAALNMPDLPGKTAAFVDWSGSMDNPVSQKSSVKKNMAGTALCAVLAKRLGSRATIGTFGESYGKVHFSPSDTTSRIIESIKKMGASTGHSTNAWLAVQNLIDTATFVDRIFVFSDEQLYNSVGTGNRSGRTLQSVYAEYVKKVNPKCRIISVDIGNYGSGSSLAPNPQVYLTGGYADTLLKEVLIWEGLLSEEKTQSVTASLDYVRTKYL